MPDNLEHSHYLAGNACSKKLIKVKLVLPNPGVSWVMRTNMAVEPKFSSNTSDYCVFKFLCCVDEKHSMHFQ